MEEKKKVRCGRYVMFDLPADLVEKVAEMAKGDSFNDAVHQFAVYGITSAYIEFKKTQKEKKSE